MRRKRSERGLSWILIAVLLAILNPSIEQHRYAINNEVKKEHPLAGLLGAGKVIGSLAAYENYLFFSTTTIKGQAITIGALGMVWVLTPEAGGPKV